jgi:hypothetical protein
MKTLLGTIILLASTTLADAAIVFQDHFNRRDSHTVGNGWAEIEDTPTEDAQILGHELELSDASVTQHLDLTGKFNTTLEFEWFASLFGDHLDVLLSLDGIAYSLVAKFSLNIPNFQHVTLSLPQKG